MNKCKICQEKWTMSVVNENTPICPVCLKNKDKYTDLKSDK